MATNQRSLLHEAISHLPNLPTREPYELYTADTSEQQARELFIRKHGYPPDWVGRVKPGDIAAGPVLADEAARVARALCQLKMPAGIQIWNGLTTADGFTHTTEQQTAAPSGEEETRLL